MKTDTICAISTPFGEGAIGIVRLSGEDAIKIADRIFYGKIRAKDAPSHTIHYGKIIEPDTKEIIDEVLLTIMRAPSTYTREDVVEINAHGGRVALSKILSLCIKEGARLAEPGEFTKRAFLHGRITLPEAEAVLQVIRAKTEKALELAQKNLSGLLSKKMKSIEEKLLSLLAEVEAEIEFPDEALSTQWMEAELESVIKDIEEIRENAKYTKILSEGECIAIIGRPNVGKSSLFNALLGRERAIVSSICGTTRDAISECVSMDGVFFKIVDTAGLRRKAFGIGEKAQKKTKEYIDESALLLFVLDASRGIKDEDYWIAEQIREKKKIVVLNKCDLPLHIKEEDVKEIAPNAPILYTSATEGIGIKEARTLIKEMLEEGMPKELFLINERQTELLKELKEELEKAIEFKKEETAELFAFHIREGLSKISQFLGTDFVEETLEQIFSKFCIGK